MEGGRRARAAAALIVVAVVSACHRRPASASPALQHAIAADSLQGVVQVVGVGAFPQVVLALDDRSPAITLDGPTSLRRVAGLRVAVVGARVGKRFTVSGFIVVAANGLPAVDGTLAASGNVLTLVTADGRRFPLVNPSPALRAAIGHRVWISGPLDHEAVAYGIIE